MAQDSMYSGADNLSNPEYNPVYGWKGFENYFYPMAEHYRRYATNGQNKLYKQFKDAYLGGSEDAAANAKIYQDYAKNLFANQPDQFESYKQTGDYLYGQFDKFAQNSANAGNRAMNERAAALGYGGQGANSYLAKINADRITSNLAPAFSNTTNAIAPGYQAQSNNNYRETMTRLGLADSDALNGYMDRVYARPLDVAAVRENQLNWLGQGYGNLVDNYTKNIAGWKVDERNDWVKYGRIFDSYMNGMYEGKGGGGGTPPPANQPSGTPTNTYTSNYNSLLNSTGGYNPSVNYANTGAYGG